MNKQNTETKNYDKLIKVLQICAGVFMVAMLVGIFAFLNAKGISIKDPKTVLQYLDDNLLKTAIILIVFTVVKSFALVITPSFVFVISGFIFKDNLIVAILVNLIATEISLALPYYLGRFTGKGMVDSLTRRFPKVKKIDDFAGQNGFVISLVVKASGLIPGDTSSLLLGAMDIPFWKFFIGSSIGVLPLNIMWAILGNKGDFNNPYTLLYLLPIVAFVILMAFVVKKVTGKNKKADDSVPDEKIVETE